MLYIQYPISDNPIQFNTRVQFFNEDFFVGFGATDCRLSLQGSHRMDAADPLGYPALGGKASATNFRA